MHTALTAACAVALRGNIDGISRLPPEQQGDDETGEVRPPEQADSHRGNRVDGLVTHRYSFFRNTPRTTQRVPGGT